MFWGSVQERLENRIIESTIHKGLSEDPSEHDLRLYEYLDRPCEKGMFRLIVDNIIMNIINSSTTDLDV